MARGLTTEEFVEKAKEKHGDKYDYSLAIYKNYLTPVIVVCAEHGQFSQKPNNHLFGAECPMCSAEIKLKKLSSDKSEFIEKAQEKFGSKYTYERVDYLNSKTPVIVTCAKHGFFSVTPNAFLSEHTGCSTCSGSKLSTASFIVRAKAVHGERYSYENSRVAGYHGVVTITCKEHGDFEQTPNNHFQGKGCLKCAGRMTSDTESFIAAAKNIHGDKYDYSEVEYVSSFVKVKINCKKHGLFSQTPANHTTGNGCSKCVSKVSKPEIELFDFVKSICPDAQQSVRSIISPFELDIVVESKKIAIEFNGLYFHSDRNQGKSDSYHFDKMENAKREGYRLIQVWEDDWKFKKYVVKKTIAHILGSTEKRVFARKCKPVTPKLRDVAHFFTYNHLQGPPRQGEAYALEFEDEIVSAMVFHPVVSERGAIADKTRWELGRYAASASVVGGASKAFSSFVIAHPECLEIISYSDNDWFGGVMYEKLGFVLDGEVKPDYKVVDGGVRRHKTNYKLSELRRRFGEKFDLLLSERENCRNNGLYRVYNSGLKKWKWIRE